MISKVFLKGKTCAVLAAAVACLGLARADEKVGMPDLAQIEQTCLPTSTGNLMIWFGHHGYPKLILPGDNEDARDLHTVHQIMTDTDARFDWGTRQDAVTTGILKFIKDAGYVADVEYRGMEGSGTPFSQDWLKENDAPNKGFILLLNYCHVDVQTHTFTNAWNAGHAVTLVNAEPDMLLIHDPAHEDDETGRKIVTPYTITEGTWREMGESRSVAGLLLLSGSLLEGPEDGQVVLTGAVCVTMHPVEDPTSSSKSAAVSGPTSTLAGGSSAPVTVAGASAPASSGKGGASWWSWIFDCVFKK